MTRREYKTKGKQHAAKFMPCYDGPYVIIDTHLEASTVTLDMPNAPNLFPTFHTAHVKPWRANDDEKYPTRTLSLPGPIEVKGAEEYLVDKIIDHKKMGRGYRYLVHFKGYGSEDDRWIAGRDLEDNIALDVYWNKHPEDRPPVFENSLIPSSSTTP
jgi:Chromo (CHRromatin Organisation MOdifier) domain